MYVSDIEVCICVCGWSVFVSFVETEFQSKVEICITNLLARYGDSYTHSSIKLWRKNKVREGNCVLQSCVVGLLVRKSMISRKNIIKLVTEV